MDIDLAQSLSQIRGVVIGVLALSAYAFWEAWRAVSAGNMMSIYCGGSYSKTSCYIGSWMGRLLFGTQNEYMGYVLLHVAVGVFLAVSILRLYVIETEKVRGQQAHH